MGFHGPAANVTIELVADLAVVDFNRDGESSTWWWTNELSAPGQGFWLFLGTGGGQPAAPAPARHTQRGEKVRTSSAAGGWCAFRLTHPGIRRTGCGRSSR